MPRYTIGSVTGLRYMRPEMRFPWNRYPPVERSGSRKGAATTWYVYDRPFGYRQVAYFDGILGRILAEVDARRRNGNYERWLREQGLA
jgi:hypothetical protein